MDRELYVSTVALMLFSLVAVYSLSIFPTVYFDASKFYFLKKELISVLIAFFILIFVGSLNPYKLFKPIGFTLFIVSFALIFIMIFLPESLVKAVLGAKRWIKLGSFSIAPTEFFKYGFLFFISWSLARKEKDLKNSKSLFAEISILFPYFFLLAVSVLIIAVGQKDLGQSVVITVTLFTIIILASGSKKLFIALFSIFAIGLLTLIEIAPHRIARFKGWWVGIQDTFLTFLPHSWKVTDTAVPLHITNSLKAIETGGVIGQGLGEGQYKLGFLSEVHTDFIIAGISEEIGLFGLTLLFALYGYVIYRIFFIGSKLKKTYERYFVYGVATIIFVSLAINLYGITGLIPIKGIAVPLLSYGGSQIIATSFGIAMVLMLSRKVKE